MVVQSTNLFYRLQSTNLFYRLQMDVLNDNQIYVTTKFTSKYARANATGKFKT